MPSIFGFGILDKIRPGILIPKEGGIRPGIIIPKSGGEGGVIGKEFVDDIEYDIKKTIANALSHIPQEIMRMRILKRMGVRKP